VHFQRSVQEVLAQFDNVGTSQQRELVARLSTLPLLLQIVARDRVGSHPDGSGWSCGKGVI
jgi:hypothetical protein